MTDQELLRSIGEALYGPQWQTSLARKLRISARHMRRMVAGHPVAPHRWSDLLSIVEQHQDELVRARGRLVVHTLYEADQRNGS